MTCSAVSTGMMRLSGWTMWTQVFFTEGERDSTIPPPTNHNSRTMTLLITRVSLLALFAVAICSGCAAPSDLKHDPPVIREHVIALDGRGRPHDPATIDGREYGMKEYRDQIKQMLLAMRGFFKTHPDRQILLFVHGGMNAPADSLRNADDEMDQVIAAGYYPIYLDWNSDLLNSYGEHVSSITQGQTDHTLRRQLLTPFYVIADLLRATARLPIVWINQAGGDAEAAIGDITAPP